MNTDIVIKVNDLDEIIGYADKMEVHKKGILHRAISIFIVNSKGEWLLQQRAEKKYHSELLWSNTCCTHPLKGETTLDAANRRLREEMGMATSLSKLFSFQYYANLNNALIENELDHIYWGVTDQIPAVNPKEVASYRYIAPELLEQEINKEPEKFTEWFKMLFEKVRKEVEQ